MRPLEGFRTSEHNTSNGISSASALAIDGLPADSAESGCWRDDAEEDTTNDIVGTAASKDSDAAEYGTGDNNA